MKHWQQTLSLFRTTLDRVRFWLSFPFVRVGYQIRERHRDRLRFPRRWLSPQQIVSLDLDLIDDDDLSKLDRSLLDLLVSRRDYIKANSAKTSLFNLSLSLFLVANYFKVGTDVSVFGISIKDSPGVAEVLLMISATMALYISTLQGNVAVLEGAIDHLIGKVFPAGASNVMRAALLTDGAMGKYYPLNLPHLPFTNFHRRLAVSLAYFTIVIALFVGAVIIWLNIKLMISIWDISSIGKYSKLSVIYVSICGIFSYL